MTNLNDYTRNLSIQNKKTLSVKVIAIRDAPIVDSKQFGNGIQAYKKGDVFEVMSSFSGQIVVWYPKIDSTMALESKNFELLSEFRNKQIDEIIR